MRLYMMIVLIVILILLYGLRSLRRKTTLMLEQVLYQKQAPSVYLELLQNPRLKLLYRKSTMMMFQLDAYLMLDDHQKIKEQMNLLTLLPLTKQEKLDFLMKKLSYYCAQQDFETATQAFTEWKDLLKKEKSEQAQKLLQEGEIIYRLYLKHDQALVSILHEQLKTSTGYQKGLTYYRLAKLAYYRQDASKMDANLKQADILLKGSTWQDTVQEALHDPAIMEIR